MNDNMGMPAINSTMQLLLPHCCSDWRSGHRLLALIDSAVDAHVFRCKKKKKWATVQISLLMFLVRIDFLPHAS